MNGISMKNNPQAWALYWRNILADTSWSIIIDSKDMQFTDVNIDHLKDLHLPERTVKKLFKEGASGKDEELESIEVAISPVIFVRNKEHMEKSDTLPDKVAPIWIRLDLYPDGSLSFNMDRYRESQRDIWITRHYLSPTQSVGKGKEGLIFGNVDDMDHFIANNVFTGAEWKNTIDAETLAKKGLRVVFSSFFDAGISATLNNVGGVAIKAAGAIYDGVVGRKIVDHYSSEAGEIIADELGDAFLPKIERNKKDHVDFDSILDYSLSMLKAVSPDYLVQMEELGYAIIDNQHGAVATYPDNSNMTRHIKNGYNYILNLEPNKIPELFKTYASAQKAEPNKPFKPITCFKYGELHSGHMSNEHGLSASQREAVSHIEMHKEEGGIIAVNGPPGTGKTTLLQDVVASEWVSSALKSKDALEAVPCVIAASSTNNQAVTNIIESFQSIEGVRRWLPDPSDDSKMLSGVGMYLTNSSDASKKGYHYTKSRKKGDEPGAGLPSMIETPEYVAKATAVFLKEYSNEYSVTDDVISVENSAIHLHEVLNGHFMGLHEINKLTIELHETFKDVFGNTIERELKALEVSFKEASAQHEILEIYHDKWLEHVEMEPFLISLLSFLPPFKKKQVARNKRLFKGLTGLPFTYSNQSEKVVNSLFDDALNKAKNKCRSLAEKIDLQEKEKQRYSDIRDRLVSLCAVHIGVNNPDQVLDLISGVDEFHNDSKEQKSFSGRIDTILRYKMFIVALHFWEARWLLSVSKLFEGGKRLKEYANKAGREGLWRRYAMLTPCLVTTMHSGPSFFSFYNGENNPMLGFIDLLIVDEAGQVSPELAGPMFSLAKRAVVVGDCQQIEPVWPVTAHMDYASLAHYNIYDNAEAAEMNNNTGMHCSSGSVMRIAQNSSPIQKQIKGDYQYERGMFLAEHRRCVDPLVSYFNELAYGGQIIPLRADPPAADSGLTPWQHLHVEGTDEKVGSSRKNIAEAKAIAAWIKEHQAFLEGYYKKPITEIVGIITPFAVQHKTIEKELRSQGITSSSTQIKGGTVHALQGAERSVILFSTVYGTPGGSYFFNQGVNMLNVAVSRAKDVFVVVGNREILNPNGRQPLDLMDKYFK